MPELPGESASLTRILDEHRVEGIAFRDFHERMRYRTRGISDGRREAACCRCDYRGSTRASIEKVERNGKRVGDLVVEMGFATREQVEAALS